ncbi:MAG: GAF domain-containing protein [Anaerolineales bacterium]|jgi:PAS domain S-box-containing protein
MVNEIEDEKTDRSSLELLYNISREIASALDLPTVLERVLLLSMRTIKAISGSIIVLDDSGIPIDSTIIYKDKIFKHTTEQLKITLEKGLAGWVVKRQEAALIPDTSKDDRWLRRPDDEESATGPKSAVSAPLLGREKPVGVFTLVHPQPNFFSIEHLELVRAISDQAGIAVLNARLYAESNRQARVMTALAESTRAITASLRLEEVLHRILAQIDHALQVERVSLALIEPQSQELVYQASTVANRKISGIRLKLGQGIAGWVAKEGQGVVVPNVHEDQRFSPEVDQATGFQTRAVTCVPIRFHEEVIGVLEALNPKVGAFDQDALPVLTGIASLAGSAIRHAQLFQNLQATHKLYHDLFEDSIDLIVITDWEGQITEVNDQTANAYGADKKELISTKITDLHSVDHDKLGESFVHLNIGDTISYESIFYTKDKREHPIQVYVKEINIDGKSHLQWILRDITERKNLDELRDDLISMIYHDLRSPLANIVSSLDVLDNKLSLEDPAIHSLFHIAVRSTERIQRLTSSLLDINRLEAGQPIVDLQEVQPKNLIRYAVDVILPIANNKNQDLIVQIPDDIPTVMVDKEMVQRVLINLLENAVKFTPPDGKIQVTASQKNHQWIHICVQDTGPGIPKNNHDIIFDKYARLHTIDRPHGIGLGLAYCRLAVEGHNGRIWVKDAPDGGAIFTFTLPTNQYFLLPK